MTEKIKTIGWVLILLGLWFIWRARERAGSAA